MYPQGFSCKELVSNKKNNLKIADFGLTRKLTSSDHYYRKQAVSLLPVKWMTPELLIQSIYLLRSDVWSFGILLWEIESLGKTSYPTVPVENISRILMEGHRMMWPPNCPIKLKIIDYTNMNQ